MGKDFESLLRAGIAKRRGFALASLAFLAVFALALFVGLGAESIGRISEVRCVAVVRHMVESGEWLVPKLGSSVRLQKPPLFYWAGAAVATLSGDLGPWSVRAVSAAAALALAAVVIAWGRTLGGAGFGLLAASCLVAMQQVTSSGRRGDAEMLLVCLSTAALFCFDRMHTERRAGLLPLFAGLVGLAILTKATAVLITVVAPIAVYLALRRELGVLRDRRLVATGAAALAIGLSWYVAVLVFVPGAFESLRDALLLPVGAAEDHVGSNHFKVPWWYLSVLPVRALPATLLLPLVIWRLWVTRVYRGEPRLRFAALAFLVPFAAFSILPQKQKHYTLGMLPGLALCTADALFAAARELGPRFALAVRAVGTPLALVGLTAVLWLALFFVWVEGAAIGWVVAGAALPFASFAASGVAAVRARPAAFCAGWIVGFLLVLAAGRGIVEARIEILARDFTALSLDDRERIIRVAREHPWFARQVLMNLDGSADED